MSMAVTSSHHDQHFDKVAISGDKLQLEWFTGFRGIPAALLAHHR